MDSAVARWLKKPRLATDRDRYLKFMLSINRAHVIMLVEERLIDELAGGALLRAIDVVEREPDRLARFSDREDLYFMVEAAITDICGTATGGLLHIGRSRNDITACMTKMAFRDTLLRLRGDVLHLIRELAQLASRHIETIMPGYTHLRPAQPTTFGHYLTGVVTALQRDYERLQAVEQGLRSCPMGAAAFAGTRFPINPRRISELLGFERPLDHSLDAVASRDYVLAFLSAASILATTLGRFVQDLYVWSTVELGFVRLSPKITGISSIMPQKQNPVVLERCRSKVAHIAAAYVDALMAMKGTGFMHSQDTSIDSVSPAWEAATELEAMVQVMTEVVSGLQVDVARMAAASGVGYTTATEVADSFVQNGRMSFRQAHGVVSRAVAKAWSEGADVRRLADLLEKEADADGLGPLGLTPTALAELMDPGRSVRQKRSPGSPAPEEVRRNLADIVSWFETAAQQLDAALARLAQSDAMLNRVADRISQQNTEQSTGR